MSSRVSSCIARKVSSSAHAWRSTICGIRRSKTIRNPRHDVPAHDVERIGIQRRAASEKLEAGIVRLVATQQRGRRAVREQRGRDDIAGRGIVAQQREAAHLRAEEKDALARMADEVVVRDAEARDAAGAAKPPDRRAPDVPREAKHVDQPRVDRRCGQAGRVHVDHAIDVVRRQPVPFEHLPSRARAERRRGVDVGGAVLGERVIGEVPLGRLAHAPRLDAGILENRHEPLEVVHHGTECLTSERRGQCLRDDVLGGGADDVDQAGHSVTANVHCSPAVVEAREYGRSTHFACKCEGISSVNPFSHAERRTLITI